MSSHPPLDQKSIVIVGGTSGLGLSAAKACVAAGASVVATGRNESQCRVAASQLGAHARVVAGDARKPNDVLRAIETAVFEFGKLDGLYHVAGGSGRSQGDGPLHEVTDEGWRATMDHNLTSLFNSNRAAIQRFLTQGAGGVVLNMSSVLAYSPSPRHFATHAYAAAKAAIIGLTTSTAAYYASHNIRVNAVCPALVETPMAKRAVGDETIAEYIRAKQPLDGGRVGQPEDLNEAVIFFLSDASRFVTGQTLAIDGGWSVSDGHLETI